MTIRDLAIAEAQRADDAGRHADLLRHLSSAFRTSGDRGLKLLAAARRESSVDAFRVLDQWLALARRRLGTAGVVMGRSLETELGRIALGIGEHEPLRRIRLRGAISVGDTSINRNGLERDRPHFRAAAGSLSVVDDLPITLGHGELVLGHVDEYVLEPTGAINFYGSLDRIESAAAVMFGEVTACSISGNGRVLEFASGLSEARDLTISSIGLVPSGALASARAEIGAAPLHSRSLDRLAGDLRRWAESHPAPRRAGSPVPPPRRRRSPLDPVDREALRAWRPGQPLPRGVRFRDEHGWTSGGPTLGRVLSVR